MVTRPADDRVVRLLQEARDKLESERLRRMEPIALVGIGCRFPGGVEGPAAFWRLLEAGVDATGEVPPSRWDSEAIYDADPDAPGRSYVERGGFLGDVDGFDAAFFGISPREARGLDPQQRLLLETTWEALEDAGIPALSLRGTNAGVWVGFSLDDYARRSGGDPHASLGNARSIAAGRIAYVLGTHGPTLQLDTACSSSLVAVHLACQSLRAGECDVAIVGGVNLLLSPESTIALCKLRALSPDGRCKAFDASGDGYGRGEGCGVVILRRLSDVRQAHDSVYALVKGSAINHDGRSNGLTAPNGAAQEAVIRQALASARVEPASVGYVEAHGTGTPLGDPIELLALGRVYSEGRPPEQPLLVGSVKTNIGHLEGAGGIAGLIKAALSLQAKRVCAHLHFEHPNPRVPWGSLPLGVPRETCAWPAGPSPARAGVSAFGISGTNAHLILEEAPALARAAAVEARSAELLVLSAHDDVALSATARRLLQLIEARPELELYALAHALTATRSALERRVAFAATSLGSAAAALREYLALPAQARGSAEALPSGGVAFVFPGQGSQWLGMGRQLLVEEPAFREQLELCDAAIRAEVGWSVLDELAASESGSRLQQVDVVQPVLFAFQVALAATWQAWGVQPAALIGHSMGEVAAACVAGALSLRDGAAVICRRSRLLKRISGSGAMALVELSIAETERAIERHAGRVSVAVSNGSRSTVISGDPAAIADIAHELAARDVFVRHVKVDVASHSPQVDPLLADLKRELAGLDPGGAALPMYSTVRCALLEGRELDARYWADNLRQPVQFARVTRELLAKGVTRFIEVSPHPLLTLAIPSLAEEAGVEALAVASLRRDQPERKTMLDALGALFTSGEALDSRKLYPGEASRVALPSYAWQRQRYWLDDVASAASAGPALGHPLLGARLRSPRCDGAFEASLLASAPSWLGDHVVAGDVLFPATGFVELVRAAAALAAPPGLDIESLDIHQPLQLEREAARCVQTWVEGSLVSVHAQPLQQPTAPWTLHATATLGRSAPGPARDLESARARCAQDVNVEALYARLGALGLSYGARFRGLTRAWAAPGRAIGRAEALGHVALPPGVTPQPYGIHPALLDAALHVLAVILPPERLLLPVAVRGFSLQQHGAAQAWVHVERLPGDDVACRVQLWDPDGRPLAAIERLELREAAPRAAAGEAAPAGLFELCWRVSRGRAGLERAPRRWALLDTGPAARAVAEGLAGRGASADLVALDALSGCRPGAELVCVWEGAPTEDLLGLVAAGLAAWQAVERAAGWGRLWWVTCAAVDVGGGEDVSPWASALSSLGLSARQENPGLPCTLLDAPLAEVADALLAEAGLDEPAERVAWRQSGRYLPELRPLDASDARRRATPPIRADGSVLITGGLGGLGLAAARYFARGGVQHLMLVGRSAGAAPAESVRELEALGAQVTVCQADVSDAAAVERVLRMVPERYPLRAIVHAAGVLDDGVVAEQTPARAWAVLAPKAVGAWNLHQLTQHLELDAVLFYSSLAGVLGSAGQAPYAAANGFLDGLALARQKRGLSAQSIAWGPWRDRGLASTLDARHVARLREQGVERLDEAQGAELLERALGLRVATLVAARLDLARGASRAAERQSGGGDPALRRAFESAPDAELRPLLLGHLRSATSRVLQLRDSSALSDGRPLRDFGLDSLMGLQLRHGLEKALGVRLPSSPQLAQQSVQAIVEALLVSRSRQPERAAPSELGAGPGGARVEAPADWACLEVLPAARVRLFCFHDAGGGSTLFAPFRALGAAGVEVHVIEHRRETPLSAAAAREYLDLALRYIGGLGDAPYVLLGHSMGAVAAWRVARELHARGLPPPALFVPSAPPVAPDARASRTDTSDVVAALIERGKLKSQASVAAFAQRFEADVALLTALPTGDFEPIATPTAAFIGSSDTLVSQSLVEGWARCTSAEFSLTIVPGDHFYLTEDAARASFLEQLQQHIERALRTPRSAVAAEQGRALSSGRD